MTVSMDSYTLLHQSSEVPAEWLCFCHLRVITLGNDTLQKNMKVILAAGLFFIVKATFNKVSCISYLDFWGEV